MTSSHLQDIEAFTAPLLRTLEALTWVARHLHPIGYSHLLRDAGLSGDELRTALAMPPWPEPYSALRPVLDAGASYALAAVDGLIEAAGPPEDITQAWRALRYFPRALETLYPLAGILPQLNRYFLDASHRDDADLTRRLMKQLAPDDTGVICFGDDTARDAVWVYVPRATMPPHRIPSSLRCMAAQAMAAPFSGVGCAPPARAAPSSSRQARSARPGQSRAATRTRHASRRSCASYSNAGPLTPPASC